MAYRRPDREVLDELDGHDERVRSILADADRNQRRRGRWRRLGLAVGGLSLLAGLGALGWMLRDLWPYALFVVAVTGFAMGGAFVGSRVGDDPRRGRDSHRLSEASGPLLIIAGMCTGGRIVRYLLDPCPSR